MRALMPLCQLALQKGGQLLGRVRDPLQEGHLEAGQVRRVHNGSSSLMPRTIGIGSDIVCAE